MICRAVFLSLGLLLSMASSALDLQSAKQQGLVGEQRNGLLGAVKPASKEVSRLLDTINSQRMQAYRRIASKNGTDLEVVQILAGKKAIEKTASGLYIKPDNRWLKAP